MRRRGRVVGGLVSLMFWHGLPAWACAFLIATGTYTGNGTDNRDITVSTSFPIALVLIKVDGTNVPVFSHTSMSADTTAFMSVNAAFASDCIQSLGTGTFQVGTNGACNANGSTYFYMVIGQNSRNDFSVGTYTGSAVDNRNITISPAFQPDFCSVSGNNTSAGARPWLIPEMGADNACAWTNATCSSNRIQQFNSDGFQIGSNASVNTNAITYSYFCLKSGAPSIAGNTYTGDGVDDRAITGLGFAPVFVMTKRDSTNPAAIRFSSQVGDTALIGGLSASANVIQSFTSDGFTLGTDAASNASTATYYYYAIGSQPSLRRAGGVLWLN